MSKVDQVIAGRVLKTPKLKPKFLKIKYDYLNKQTKSDFNQKKNKMFESLC
jgi:hypothetical protein